MQKNYNQTKLNKLHWQSIIVINLHIKRSYKTKNQTKNNKQKLSTTEIWESTKNSNKLDASNSTFLLASALHFYSSLFN